MAEHIVDDDEDAEDEDLDFEDHPDLPPEAGKITDRGFEPNDDWLQNANRKLQHEAMRQWFLSRYCDPANDTPYNGQEGGYLYIHGGPFQAEDQLYGRFGDIVENPDRVIRAVIDDVESDGLTEWAPIHHEREDEFDERFALTIDSDSEPLRKLRQRLRQQQAILALEGADETKVLARQLVFAATIGALETFLYEVAYFWIENDEKALRAMVTGLQIFREEKISLADVFKQMEGLKDRLKGHLQATVWHRWEHVAQIYRAALGIKLPSVKALADPLLKRHHIVHRSGHDNDGAPVQISDADISALAATIEEFAVELETRINQRSGDATGTAGFTSVPR